MLLVTGGDGGSRVMSDSRQFVVSTSSENVCGGEGKYMFTFNFPTGQTTPTHISTLSKTELWGEQSRRHGKIGLCRCDDKSDE